MYDADNNGYITRDELVEIISNSTRWMGDCDVESREVQELIHSEVLFSFVSFCLQFPFQHLGR